MRVVQLAENDYTRDLSKRQGVIMFEEQLWNWQGMITILGRQWCSWQGMIITYERQL